MCHPLPLFRLFSVFFKQTLIQFLQQINVKNDISIQYTAKGFEPTTSEQYLSPIITRPGIPPFQHKVWLTLECLRLFGYSATPHGAF